MYKKLQTCLLITIFSFPFAGCGLLGIKDVFHETDPATGAETVTLIPSSEGAGETLQTVLGVAQETNEFLYILAGLAGLGALRPVFLASKSVLGKFQVGKTGKGKKA